jgi:Domain of unknown function (DUF4193)
MEDNIDEALEDEELEVDEDAEDEAEAPAQPGAEPEEGAVESSLEELLAKREPRPAEEEEEEDDSLLTLGREERLEPLAVKVIPPSDKEFVCKNCHLVKHRSQLKDRSRMLCRDCA